MNQHQSDPWGLGMGVNSALNTLVSQSKGAGGDMTWHGLFQISMISRHSGLVALLDLQWRDGARTFNMIIMTFFMSVVFLGLFVFLSKKRTHCAPLHYNCRLFVCIWDIRGTYVYIVGIVQVTFQGAGRLDLCRISLQQAQVLGILVALPSNLTPWDAACLMHVVMESHGLMILIMVVAHCSFV